MISNFQRIDAIFRFCATALDDIMGGIEVSLDAVNRESCINMVSSNVIPECSNIAEYVSPFPVFALESYVFLVKPSQVVDYHTA